MKIEERELRFRPTAPLSAWRLFRVRRCAGGFLLCSPMYHDPDPPPWERSEVATCTGSHLAPAPGCRCGIYGIVRGTLDSLPGYLRDTAHDLDAWAYAEIACSGRVFLDHRGVRAERAGIVRIALVESCWPDEAALATATRLLAAHYGVPVGGRTGIPAWVVENAQAEGPPPRGATLDLDAIDLGPNG